jgi:aryl-alcohol dehydrogenase-like predicted oxidoreductase
VIEQAAKLNKGIFIKKALGSGHLAKNSADDNVQANFDFIFNEPAVSSVIIGTINPAHLRDNISKVVKALTK